MRPVRGLNHSYHGHGNNGDNAMIALDTSIIPFDSFFTLYVGHYLSGSDIARINLAMSRDPWAQWRSRYYPLPMRIAYYPRIQPV